MQKYVVASAVTSALFLGACQLLLGIEERTESVAPQEEASLPTGPSDAGADTLDPCSSDNVPAAPASEVDAGAPDRDLLFVMTGVDFGLDGGLPFGVNLDTRCTCPGPSACNRPPDAPPICDEPNGVDNAAKRVFTALRTLEVEKTVNETLQVGGPGALLRVRDYNGQANDPNVTVALYGSLGVEGSLTGGPLDRFRVDTTTVAGENVEAPKNETSRAWVKDSVLVASIGAELRLGGANGQPPLATELSAGYIIAKIDERGTLSGVISGRWELKKALGSLQLFRLPGTTEPMCADSGVFQSIRALMCGAADITAKVEVQDKNVACDALSVQVGFSARLASFGRVATRADAGGADCQTSPTCGP